ncbi:MAG TPA: 2-polyprenyl-3-methyl-6-methoxy-1,4-benzoquinone monooxygenase, partial [Gammaproteobacteria bacterium]
TSLEDRLLIAADQALKTLAAPPGAARPSPAANLEEPELTADERAQCAALMRVNHAGEIAAQALYSGQAVFARTDETREHLLAAAAEEEDHLAWCAERIDELGGRRSLLDPVWYAGCFALGMLAGAAGDEKSLGFIAETEDQVEAHLGDHLGRLPEADTKSKAILDRMAADEARHGSTARKHGGVELPQPVRSLMSVGGEILRKIALKL